MKYIYQFNVLRYLLLLALIGIFSSSGLHAQGLSTNTTYVVNGQPDLVAPVDTFANLSGSATGPSYGAMSYLNLNGMNTVQTGTGPVVFLLSTGYNPVEPGVINIGNPAGAGGWPNMYWNANSPVIIKPAAGTSFNVTTSAVIPANGALVRFNGAWYANIDGSNNGTNSRDLSFVMPATATQTTSRVIDIMPTTGQRVQSLSIKNTRLIGNSNALAANTYAGVYFGNITAGTPTAIGQNQNIDVSNNYIIGVQNGIYFRGFASATNQQSKFVTINNNIIGDYVNPVNAANTAFIGGANGTGIYLNSVANGTIHGNTIRNTTNASSNFKGIFLTAEGGIPGVSADSNIQVTSNNIYNLNTTVSGGVTGIRMNLGTHTQHLRILIANNSISKLSATAAQAVINGFAYPIGILIEDASANVGAEVFFNSVNLTGSTLPANAFSACFATNTTTTGGIIMMNNAYSNSMGRVAANVTGYTIYNVLTLSPLTPFRYSSFNNYYTTTWDGGNAYVARLKNLDFTSLKGYKMQHRCDSTSYSTIPPFKNDSDLTVNAGVSHWMYNSGANLTQFFSFYQSIFDSIRFKINTDAFGTSRSGFGRFTSIGCHLWVGDSTNSNVALVGPRVFAINGFTQRPTALNLNGSFATVAEAVDYLNHYGSGGSGNIVLELQPGYNGETVHIPALIDYPNSNLGRPVTFRSQSNFTATISVPNQPAMNNLSVIRFMGATYVKFDGGSNKGMIITMPLLATNTNTRLISVTPVDTASSNIGVWNCQLIGNSNNIGPNTGMGIYVGHPSISGIPALALKTGLNNISFVGNEISAVRSGIVFFSPSLAVNALIKSNIIGGNIPTGTAANTTYIGGAAGQAGIWVKGVVDCNIDSNVVRNCVQTGANSNGFFGIFLDETGAANYNSVNVTRNFVYNLVTLTGTNCTGIRINLTATTGVRGISLINNFVGRIVGNGAGTNFSNLNPAGISIDAAAPQTNCGIALGHNTINLSGTGLGAVNSSSAALFMGANIRGGIEAANNIFGNRLNRTSATGNRYAVLFGHTATPFTTATIMPFPSNNNNYFATGNGTNFIAAHSNGTVNLLNINNFRSFTAATPPLAGMDGNSFNWVNTFKTDTTPDVDLLNGGLVPGGASIVTGICIDIYGNPRYQCSGGSTTITRWVGAAEVGLPYPSLQGGTTYAINGVDNPPTPFTPTTGTFKTVRSAINYLNSQGVDDPNFGGFRTVRLEIQNGYVGESDTFTQPITVLDYPRQASTRPVLLTVASGRNDTIKVTSNVNPAIAANQSLIRLSGCKYFTIDGNNGSGGKNLTLLLPAVFNTATNKVVDIISGAGPISATQPFTTNNGIKNCNIVGNSNTSTIFTFAGIYMGGLPTPSNSLVGQNSDNMFQNNFIGAVQYGVYLRGDGVVANMDNGNSVMGNTIGGSIAPNTTGNTNYFGGIANAAGVFVQSQINLTIANNTINNNITTFANPRGIELASTPLLAPVLSSDVNVYGNVISNIRSTVAGGAYGIYLNFGADNNNINRNIKIYNNMISGISAPGTNASGTGFGLNPFGIYLNGTAVIGSGNTWVGVSLYYNSVNLGVGNTLTTPNSISACLGIPSFIRSGVISRNNIFQNRLGGTTTSFNYAVAIGGTFNPFAESDFNNYFTAATSPTINANFGSNVSATRVGYNQWFEIMQFTRQDTMSITSLTPFTNDLNLYIPNSTSANIYQAGKPVIGLSTDINGTARNSFQPSMGAHEFSGTYLDDIAPRVFNVTDPTACQSGAISLDFNIYDKQLVGDTLYYRINSGTVQAIQAGFSSGTFRRFTLPAQTSGTLIEFRAVGIDYQTPPNTGYYPAGKPWDTLSTGITSFPYVNGFEGVNNPAWSNQTLSGGAAWEIGVLGSNVNPPQGARSGIRSAIFRSSNMPTVGASAQLVSPCLDFSNLNSPTLRFYISQNSDLPGKRDSVQVKVSFGGNIWSNALRTVERVNPDFPLPGYRMIEVCLGAYKTSGLRVAIEGYSAGNGQNIQIDDIQIYDDVQSQSFTPTTFNQCFRDSVRLSVSNPDARFNYRVVNMANGQTLTSKPGDGNSMFIAFMAPANSDTLRYFVEATNTTSQAVNTGFGGGFVSCSNIMKDTVTAIINRFYNGPFITAGLPFNGSYSSDGRPDGAKIGDTITYKFVPPSMYTNNNYGTLWSIPTVTAFKQATGQPFTGFSFVPPSGSNAGYVRIIAPADQLDSNIVFNFVVRINASGCDTSFQRVLRTVMQPTAIFTISPAPTNLCANNKITFNALGSIKYANNYPYSFTWLFGDGTFSITENPDKVYTTPGNYTVRFILTDNYGVSSEKVENITVLPSPVVEYTTNVPCALDSTTFTPTPQPSGSTFLWTMPNNTTQTREVAKFNFAKFDTAYDVNLRVTNTSGCYIDLKKNIYVFAKPVANFATTPHCLSNNVPITNTSTIPVGTIGYTWNWGNGQTSLSATPQYKYPASGTYSATLKVSSQFGCVDSMVKTVTIYDRPFAGFNIENPCVGDQDVTVFNNTTAFAGGAQNVNYNWTFGDFKSSTLQNPTNAYRATGNYTVFMLAVDKVNGCRDSITRNITLFNKPVAQFATSPDGVLCEGNELKVLNSSYTIDGTLFNCNWNWGDGKTDSICNINHTYTQHALYTIKLVTTTINGCKDTATKDLTVNLPPVLDITVTDTNVAAYPYCKNKKFISASIKDAEYWNWTMGDAGNSTYSGNDFEFVYATKGIYKLKCVVKDLNGCVVSDSATVDIFCSVGLPSAVAASFDLQAYPNPFGQSTNVSFELPNAADVKVTVMDMLGRTIKTADLGRLQSGKHNRVIDEFGAAGTYLIKVEVDGVAIYKQVVKQ